MEIENSPIQFPIEVKGPHVKMILDLMRPRSDLEIKIASIRDDKALRQYEREVEQRQSGR